MSKGQQLQVPETPNQPVVLVADDEPIVRNIVRLTLQKAGYFVLAACDGEEALVLSRNFPGNIHLLLSDIMMPKLDGAALAAQILLERPKIKVLLMSGFGREPEGHAFLPKPFQMEDLKRRMELLLQKTAAAG